MAAQILFALAAGLVLGVVVAVLAEPEIAFVHVEVDHALGSVGVPDHLHSRGLLAAVAFLAGALALEALVRLDDGLGFAVELDVSIATAVLDCDGLVGVVLDLDAAGFGHVKFIVKISYPGFKEVCGISKCQLMQRNAYFTVQSLSIMAEKFHPTHVYVYKGKNCIGLKIS